MMPLTTGEVLQNRYRIVSLLGQGGMGAVYRAWDTRLDVVVALKEMTAQPGLDPQLLAQLRQQFRQEAVVLARLHHPHLVRVTDFFEEGGNAYLVMDFVEGENLVQRIRREGAQPEAQVLRWTEQLLDALAYCHAQRVIHRDIKPQNVIICPDGQAVLVDFGLVKLWNPYDPQTRTAMRGLGTPEYAPPEQYDAQIGHTDPRSDIYSLGATIYHALTGQAPPTATMRIANPGLFQRPRMVNPHISPTTEAAVLRAAELTVGNRFASAQEMMAALRGEVVPPSTPTVSTLQAVPRAQPSSSTRRRRVPAWAWAVGGLATLALVAGLAGAALIIADRTGNFTPTPQVEPTATTSVSLVAEATATLPASPTPTQTPTGTPVVTKRALGATSTPVSTPGGAPKGTPSPTPTPTASRTPTPTPQPTSPPPSGALITFEQWGSWRRGDQPYGELTQTQEQVHSGSYAARLSYDFPVTDQDFVVFVHPLNLAGQPDTIAAWVYGDGSAHYLNVWVQDAQDEVWSVYLGQVGGSGWKQMAGTLDPSLPWPSGHISGPENSVVDYPVRFYALVLDRPGSGPQRGEIYIDDISAWRKAGATATPPPAATVTPAPGRETPTVTTAPPVSAGPLDFPVPSQLDGWETLADGHRATIIVHISGGAPPFTIYHDVDRFVTWERDYPLVFTSGGCVIVHTIIVESADGQKVSHDYYIQVPGCD